jgi:hypothetical protein
MESFVGVKKREERKERKNLALSAFSIILLLTL